jgi:hypothetical protein
MRLRSSSGSTDSVAVAFFVDLLYISAAVYGYVFCQLLCVRPAVLVLLLWAWALVRAGGRVRRRRIREKL